MNLTKTKRKEYVRNLLDTIKVGKWFNEEEVYLFNNLTGYTYKKYKLVLHPEPHKQHSLVRNVYVDDVKEMRSWHKQIDDYDQKKKLEVNQLQAMRHSIENVLFEERKKYSECCICGSKKNITCDHKTIPFIDIAKSFLHYYPEWETYTPEGKFGHYFIDNELEQLFLQIHNEVADYQALCRSCNSSKGSK
jgi:hypothetical protein